MRVTVSGGLASSRAANRPSPEASTEQPQAGWHDALCHTSHEVQQTSDRGSPRGAGHVAVGRATSPSAAHVLGWQVCRQGACHEARAWTGPSTILLESTEAEILPPRRLSSLLPR
jgi:hypothetical protein